eukprot:10477488-Prorocentrum_lima.AAC.1
MPPLELSFSSGGGDLSINRYLPRFRCLHTLQSLLCHIPGVPHGKRGEVSMRTLGGLISLCPTHRNNIT